MLRNIPIRRKLMLIILVTSIVVMLLMRGAFFTYEFVTFRQATIRQAVILGDILAANSTAALAFDNPEDAREILSALQAEEHVSAAALYDRNGRLFSVYPETLAPGAVPATPGANGYRFSESNLAGFSPVLQKNRRLGTLYLRFDTGVVMRQWLWGSFKLALAVMAVILLVAYLLSRSLQRHISQPILALAGTARAISERRDYSVRATKQGNDELGLLTDAFNQMLAQIHGQNQALRESEKHFRFLNDLGEATRNLADPKHIMTVTAQMLGQHLHASRCAYADVEPDSERFSILYDYTDGCASTVGAYQLSLFGPRAMATLHSGKTLVIRNVGTELRPEEGADMFKAIGIQAIITCPLVKDGRLRAMVAVHQTIPRDWQEREIAIVQDVVERCWATLERRTAEEKIARLNVELEQRVIERTAQLETANAEFKSLFESIDEGYCIVEVLFDDRNRPVDYRFLSINPAFEKHTGVSGAQGRRMRELAPDLEAYWFETFGRIALTGEPTRFQNYAEPLHRWFDVYAFRYGAPESRQVAMLFTNITERKRSEEQIRQLNSTLQQRAGELENANRELESFSYSVSHDLRAPLRHVQGYVEMLTHEAQAQLSDKARRYLKTIADAAKEMGQLIDNLLAFSRMSRSEMHKGTVDLAALVKETRQSLEPTVNGREVRWQIAPLPAVQGDAPMLRQVFVNLMSNAVKYTGRRPVADIEIGLAGEEEGRTVFFVRDNGAGFDMKYADKLFGVFQRLHRADEFEGTGIGLASVRRIITRHGGRIWAEARPDAGATFYFTLTPASAARSAAPFQQT